MVRREDTSLRAQLMLAQALVMSCAIILISAYFVYRHQVEMRDMVAGKADVMRSDLRQKGLAVVRNLGLASERAVAVHDFLFLSEIMGTTVSHDSEIHYG